MGKWSKLGGAFKLHHFKPAMLIQYQVSHPYPQQYKEWRDEAVTENGKREQTWCIKT